MLSRDQPVFAISESAIFVLFRVCCLLCVPSKCAFSTLQALAQSPSIPDLRRKNKAEFAASQLSSTKSLFQFFSGCCFALPASRDSDLVQPMQSRTSSTKKGRSISSKSQVASQLQQQVPRRRPVVPSPRPVAALPAPKWNARRAYRIIPLCTRGRSICLQQTETIASQAVRYYCFIPRPPAPCAPPAPYGPGSAPAALAPYLPLGRLHSHRAYR